MELWFATRYAVPKARPARFSADSYEGEMMDDCFEGISYGDVTEVFLGKSSIPIELVGDELEAVRLLGRLFPADDLQSDAQVAEALREFAGRRPDLLGALLRFQERAQRMLDDSATDVDP